MAYASKAAAAFDYSTVASHLVCTWMSRWAGKEAAARRKKKQTCASHVWGRGAMCSLVKHVDVAWSARIRVKQQCASARSLSSPHTTSLATSAHATRTVLSYTVPRWSAAGVRWLAGWLGEGKCSRQQAAGSRQQAARIHPIQPASGGAWRVVSVGLIFSLAWALENQEWLAG